MSWGKIGDMIAESKVEKDIAIEAKAEKDKNDLITEAHLAHIAVEAARKQIWTPSEGQKAELRVMPSGGEVLIVDKRRITPESVEKDFQDQQEKLRQPLNNDEIMVLTKDAQKILDSEIKRRHSEKEPDGAGSRLQDLEGDKVAFGRLYQIFHGEAIGRGDDYENIHKGMDPQERLADLVEIHRESYDRDTGEVHYQGYNTSLYYQFLRAGQILDKINNDPKNVRENILNNEKPDGVYSLINEPVIDGAVLAKNKKAS